MPRLWNETIEAHRRDVRDAILETTMKLVAEEGLRSATMSRIAEETGIGRATLYKYFPDVDAILVAWHGRHVTAHLEQLAAIREQTTDPGARLDAVLAAYARIVHGMSRHGFGAEFSALVHRDEQVAEPRRQLHGLVRDVLAEAATTGHVRDDTAPDELATYCLHALAAAADLPTHAAVERLVALTVTGLRPTA
ncbi:TetR/AcrR family transcriptional regulator [Actinophytocola sp. NPDC049390]|uniref:TetR/AcrR family transcriptional regulator n=1 Tax=Actinophytocola sp. NPDC049390 TaxID=3363894 RepID=UPI0037B8B563